MAVDLLNQNSTKKNKNKEIHSKFSEENILHLNKFFFSY